MGEFSWCFCDKQNKENLVIGKGAYLLQPSGEHIFEPSYEGYGVFGGEDVYELVVDWNRKCIPNDVIRKPKEEASFAEKKYYDRANVRYQQLLHIVEMLSQDCSDEEMEQYFEENEVGYCVDGSYKIEWKRKIGIEISCYDWQNRLLKFPIKVASKVCNYEKQMPSEADICQGWYDMREKGD